VSVWLFLCTRVLKGWPRFIFTLHLFCEDEACFFSIVVKDCIHYMAVFIVLSFLDGCMRGDKNDGPAIIRNLRCALPNKHLLCVVSCLSDSER